MSGEDPIQLEEMICRIKEIEEKIKKLENPFLQKINQRKDRGMERQKRRSKLFLFFFIEK